MNVRSARTRVIERFGKFRDGQEDLNDGERYGRPMTTCILQKHRR